MKLLLTRDVDNLGVAGDVVEVAGGYGRNYLIPQGVALPATPGAVNQREAYIRAQQERRERELREMQALAEQIESLELRFEAKVGEQGRLYGSITTADIAESLSAQVGQEIDRRKIGLSEPLRELGRHEVPIHLGSALRPTLKVIVEAEGAATSAEPAAERVLTAEGQPVAEAGQGETAAGVADAEPAAETGTSEARAEEAAEAS